MPSKQDLQYADLLFAALNSQFGKRITTNDPSSLRAKLYTVRKKDSSFESLSFVLSPENPSGELWIIRRPEETIDA